MTQRIKIRMEAYDHGVLDKSALDIVETAKRTGSKVAGPIPLPTRIERYTVLRSPHADKKSREQFEIRTHKRVIEITETTAKTMDALGKLNVPAGSRLRSRHDPSASIRDGREATPAGFRGRCRLRKARQALSPEAGDPHV